MVQNESGQGIGDVQKQICKKQWFFSWIFHVSSDEACKILQAQVSAAR